MERRYVSASELMTANDGDDDDDDDDDDSRMMTR